MAAKDMSNFMKDPKKSLLALSLPITLSMIVQVMYNLADTAFVGRLGTDAIAALSFSFPLYFILIALNAGVSVGMGARISRFLGEKDKKSAANTALHGLYLSIFLAIIVSIIGILTLKPLLQVFGAEGNVLLLAQSFMTIIFLSFIIMFPAFTISSVLSAEGDTKTPMKVTIFSLIVNIILDPIFIYYLNLGVRGAAIATAISFLTALVLFIYYLQKKSSLSLRFMNFKYSKKITKDILDVGVPSTVMMLILSVYVIFLNRAMAHFGSEYVAAFGLVSRLESIAVIPLVALSIALITLVGVFYGAKKCDLIPVVSWYGIRVMLFFTLIIGVIMFAFPYIFLRIFTNDKDLIALAIPYLRIDIFTFPLMGITMMAARIMQGMGAGMPGLVINFVRVFVFAVPLAYYFVFGLGLGYLWIGAAMITGGVAASILGIIWLRKEFKQCREI